MTAVNMSFPADSYQWGPLMREGATCYQVATLLTDGKPVCQVCVQWPAPLPTVPVVCHTEGRHAGAQD